MNNRGFVLVLTMSFVLGLAMLGLGAVKWSGADHEVADQGKYSAQAFWLADAAVERAKAMLLNPPTMPYSDQVLMTGGGSSNIFNITQINTDPRIWIVKTEGTIPFDVSRSKQRFVKATIVRPVFPAPGSASLTATGNIDCSGSGNANCANKIQNGVEEDPALTFFNTFGVTWAQAVGMSTSPVLGNQNNMPNLSGINYVKVTNAQLSGSHEFSIGVLGGGGLIMIDATGTYNDVSVKFEGTSTFTGIIWIKNADVKLGSNASLFTGLMFVEGTVQGGDVTINSQPTILAPGTNNNIFTNAGLDKPMISAWQECSDISFTQCDS